jgi:hypothetical protein
MSFLFQKRISNHHKCCHYDLHAVTTFIHWYSMQFNLYNKFSTNSRTLVAWIQWIYQMVLVVLTIISSPELKAEVSYSDCLLSVVSLSVNFYIFDFSRTSGPILARFGTNHPWGKGIQVCSNEEQHPSLRGDNNKRVTICVMKHKCTRTRQIPKVAIIV